MSTLYMIRHGQASFGAADYDDLSAAGRQQARLLGDFFVRAGIRFDACWSGTLRRQRQTAGEVRARCRDAGQGMPGPTETADLNEYDYEAVLRALIPVIQQEDPGFINDVGNMLSDQRAFQKVFGRVMTRWASGRDNLDGVRPWSDFSARVTGVLENLMSAGDRGRQVAVFTSGGPIAAQVGRVMGLGAEKTISLSWQLVNASLTRFTFSRERITLSTFNEYGHLSFNGGARLVTYR
ncbi:histidine phosphatase family protein [Desulfosarcina alkanivorans]|nr:histidine phosphatase family protein [Desulfosarcina alkanivorans]